VRPSDLDILPFVICHCRWRRITFDLSTTFTPELLSDRFPCWLSGWYRRLNHSCQILCQLVQRFRSSDTQILRAILHRLSWSPLQQCKHYIVLL